MALGLGSVLWGEREFQRRADRDNAELRQDLKEAGVSHPELAAILSAQTKMQANASSHTESTVMIVLMLSISVCIPLYAGLSSEKSG